MIITTKDGKQLAYPFTPMACTGYRAERIEITADDVRRMIEMAPDRLIVALRQLQARWQ